MLTLRQRVFIIIGLISGLIIAFLLIYYLVFQKPANEQTPSGVIPSEEINFNISGQSGSGSTTVTPVVENKPVDMSIYAKQVAKIFVERFATYSNQNNNQNIDDVLSMSTPVMARWLETQRKDFVSEYIGVNTVVVASRVLNGDESKATVEVDVQQENMTNNGVQVQQKTGRVDLVMENNDWKIDGFYWNK